MKFEEEQYIDNDIFIYPEPKDDRFAMVSQGILIGYLSTQKNVDKFIADNPDSRIEVVDTVETMNDTHTEQSKVVLPKHVADWLNHCRIVEGWGLSSAMNLSEAEHYDFVYHDADSPSVESWLTTVKNQNTFAEAWLFGYELEEEQKFYALIKGHELL